MAPPRQLFIIALQAVVHHSSGDVETGPTRATGEPNMKLTFILWITMIVCRSCGANCDQSLEFHISDKVSSCSGWLSTIIFNFCNNTYKIVKRDTSLMLEKMSPKNLQQELTRRRLLAEGRWRRVRRQVANECCLRPCTVADIIAYCPSDARLLVENPGVFY